MLMPRTQADVGFHALDIIHQVLMIHAEWTSRENREFTWWGYRLAQRVTASPCFESRDLLISRIRVSVPVLDDVQKPADEVMRPLGYLNRMAVGHALVYRETEQRIEAVLAHNLHEETVEARAREIASSQIVVLAQCEQLAGAIAPLMEGEVAVRRHPLMDERPEPDDMMTVVERHYAPLGTDRPLAPNDATSRRCTPASSRGTGSRPTATYGPSCGLAPSVRRVHVPPARTGSVCS